MVHDRPEGGERLLERPQVLPVGPRHLRHGGEGPRQELLQHGLVDRRREEEVEDGHAPGLGDAGLVAPAGFNGLQHAVWRGKGRQANHSTKRERNRNEAVSLPLPFGF